MYKISSLFIRNTTSVFFMFFLSFGNILIADSYEHQIIISKEGVSYINDIDSTMIRNEFIKPYVFKRLEQLLDTEENEQVRVSWMRLFDQPSSTFLNNVEILYKLAGPEVTHKMLDMLIGIGIDVSSPYLATRYFLEVIIWGGMLIGEDIEHLKYYFINHEINTLNAQYSYRSIDVPELDENMSLATLREKYEWMMEQLSQVVLSKKNYREIDNEIRQSINLFYKRIVGVLVNRAWKQLGISKNSEALCYFREVKTFISDLDLIYIGPDQDRVNQLLTTFMFSIGIKLDIYGVDMIVADAMNHNSPNFLGGQFYRNIETVTFNIDFNDFFKKHFEKNDLSECISINNFKANQVFDAWQNIEFQDADTKEIYYVGVNHLLRGLALKYSIPCGSYDNNFWKALGNYLSTEEIHVLSDANATVNHIRNLYQMCIARRSWVLFVRTDDEWNNIKGQIANNIEHVFAQQGVLDLRKHLEVLRDNLNSIRNTHLGKPNDNVVLDGVNFPKIKSDRWYDLNRVVNEKYLLISNSRFGFDPLRQSLNERTFSKKVAGGSGNCS